MDYQYIISGEIGVAFDWWTGTKGTTVDDVKTFLSQHKDEDVDIAVSSLGGYVGAGLEIYDLIKEHGRVHMHVIGMTASAATFLTMGAASIDMVDGSLMLIHNASNDIFELTSVNKEQLDEIIAKFQKMRNDLNTIDKVIASLYAKKSGKSLQKCMDKMSEASWLSPQDALDFGLIDSIRQDEEMKKKAENLSHNYSNNIFKEFGLPPFPQQKGEPTKSIVQKSVDVVKSIFKNKSAENKQNMIKIFTNVMDLLSVKDGFELKDDAVSLTQDQMKKIDDDLGDLKKQVKDASDAKDKALSELKDLKAELKKAQDDLKTANGVVDNLKKAPATENVDHPADTNTSEDDEVKVIAESEKMYNQVKDL
ncbi:MAG: ATP-dependent Clp protease proteolytic subunit [Prevotella sp.]|jgi:ATP-dependent protease ClpP protease subunit|nr:ATP-dependent Clp protease proteolytic subunit [Prevotella sp.]